MCGFGVVELEEDTKLCCDVGWWVVVAAGGGGEGGSCLFLCALPLEGGCSS